MPEGSSGVLDNDPVRYDSAWLRGGCDFGRFGSALSVAIGALGKCSGALWNVPIKCCIF